MRSWPLKEGVRDNVRKRPRERGNVVFRGNTEA
jgi:hypothetical protein